MARESVRVARVVSRIVRSRDGGEADAVKHDQPKN